MIDQSNNRLQLSSQIVPISATTAEATKVSVVSSISSPKEFNNTIQWNITNNINTVTPKQPNWLTDTQVPVYGKLDLVNRSIENFCAEHKEAIEHHMIVKDIISLTTPPNTTKSCPKKNSQVRVWGSSSCECKCASSIWKYFDTYKETIIAIGRLKDSELNPWRERDSNELFKGSTEQAFSANLTHKITRFQEFVQRRHPCPNRPGDRKCILYNKYNFSFKFWRYHNSIYDPTRILNAKIAKFEKMSKRKRQIKAGITKSVEDPKTIGRVDDTKAQRNMNKIRRAFQKTKKSYKNDMRRKVLENSGYELQWKCWNRSKPESVGEVEFDAPAKSFLSATLGTLFSSLANALAPAWKRRFDFFSSVIDTLQAIKEFIIKVCHTIKDIVYFILGSILNLFQDTWRKIIEWVLKWLGVSTEEKESEKLDHTSEFVLKKLEEADGTNKEWSPYLQSVSEMAKRMNSGPLEGTALSKLPCTIPTQEELLMQKEIQKQAAIEYSNQIREFPKVPSIATKIMGMSLYTLLFRKYLAKFIGVGDFVRVLDVFAKAPSLTTGVKEFFVPFIELISELINKLLSLCRVPERFRIPEITSEDDKTKKLWERFQEIAKLSDGACTTESSIKLSLRIHMLNEDVNEHIKSSSISQKSAFKLTMLKKELQRVMDSSDAYKSAMHGPRSEPLSILLVGGTGVGKTTISRALCDGFLSRVIDDDLRDDFINNSDPFIFVRATENVYWEGYKFSHICVIYDDWGQLLDTPGVPSLDAMEVIRAINMSEYHLHYAGMEKKEGRHFTSKLLLGTTNRIRCDFKSIKSNAAVARRWRLCYLQVPRAEYSSNPEEREVWKRRPNSKAISRVMQNPDYVEDGYNVDLVEFHPWDIENGQPVAGGKILSYHELLDLMEKAFRDNEARGSKITNQGRLIRETRGYMTSISDKNDATICTSHGKVKEDSPCGLACPKCETEKFLCEKHKTKYVYRNGVWVCDSCLKTILTDTTPFGPPARPWIPPQRTDPNDKPMRKLSNTEEDWVKYNESLFSEPVVSEMTYHDVFHSTPLDTDVLYDDDDVDVPPITSADILAAANEACANIQALSSDEEKDDHASVMDGVPQYETQDGQIPIVRSTSVTWDNGDYEHITRLSEYIRNFDEGHYRNMPTSSLPTFRPFIRSFQCDSTFMFDACGEEELRGVLNDIDISSPRTQQWISQQGELAMLYLQSACYFGEGYTQDQCPLHPDEDIVNDSCVDCLRRLVTYLYTNNIASYRGEFADGGTIFEDEESSSDEESMRDMPYIPVTYEGEQFLADDPPQYENQMLDWAIDIAATAAISTVSLATTYVASRYIYRQTPTTTVSPVLFGPFLGFNINKSEEQYRKEVTKHMMDGGMSENDANVVATRYVEIHYHKPPANLAGKIRRKALIMIEVIKNSFFMNPLWGTFKLLSALAVAWGTMKAGISLYLWVRGEPTPDIQSNTTHGNSKSTVATKSTINYRQHVAAQATRAFRNQDGATPTDGFMNRVHGNNTYRLAVQDVFIGYITFIRGTVFMIPRHFFDRLEDQVRKVMDLKHSPEHAERMYPLEEPVLRLYDNYSMKICAQIAWSDIGWLKEYEGDLTDLKFGKVMNSPESQIQTIRPHADIIDYFPTMHQLRVIERVNGRMVIHRKTQRDLVDKCEPREFEVSLVDPDIPVTKETMTGELRTYLSSGLAYRCDTQRGDCGALIFGYGPPFSNGVILGFHTSASENNSLYLAQRRNAAGVVVSHEQALYSADLLDGITPEERKNLNAEKLRKRSGDPIEKFPKYTEQGAFPELFRSICRPDHPVLVQPTKTKLVKSPFYGVLKDSNGLPVPTLTRPAYLRPFTNMNGDVVDPAWNAFSEYSHDEPFIRTDLLDKATAIVRKNVLQHLQIQPWAPRVFSITEAWDGIAAIEGVNRIPRNTSPGYPYIINKTTKKDIVGPGEEVDQTLPLWKLHKERVDKTLDDAKNGIRNLHVFMDYLKDEKRPLEKESTRQFCAVGLDLLVAMKMTYGDVLRHITLNRIHNGIAVGTNPYVQWVDITMHLMAGYWKHYIAADFSKYDKRIPARLLWAAYEILESYYWNATEDERRQRKILFLELIQSVHYFRGELYFWWGSVASGHPLTAILNSIITQLMVYICALKATEGSGLDVTKHLRLITYGDDHIIAMSPELAPYLPMEVITKLMKEELGMTYTSEDKKEGVTGHKSLSECSFLKRTFVWKGDQVLAPLDLKTILETLQWQRGNVLDVGQFMLTIESTLFELSLHGEETWNRYGPNIIKLFHQTWSGRNLLNVTYDKSRAYNRGLAVAA